MSLKAVYGTSTPTRFGWERIGIYPLRIVVWGEPKTPLLSFALARLLAANARCGGVTGTEPQPGDLVLIPASGPVEFEEPGLFGLPSSIRKGVKGVALATIPSVAPDADRLRLAWTTLGNKATQYCVLLVGDSNSQECRSAFIFSMEGSRTEVSRGDLDLDAFFDILMARITHLAGAEVVSHWQVDYSMSREAWERTRVPDMIIETGHKLREWNLLPDIQIKQYASPKRAEQVKLYLEVSGLTVGNMSAWDDALGCMQITGSGVDKGNLTRDEILAVRSLNAQGNGSVVWAPEGARRVKPSVETYDHLLAYAASALLARGDLGQYELSKVLDDLTAPNLTDRAKGTPAFFKSMIHLHLWPERVLDPDRVHLTEVDPRIFSFHSSCGTRPLAVYSVEALLRGMAESRAANKMIVAGLPNHGLLAAAPFSLDEMTDLFHPDHSVVALGPVPTT